MAQNDALTFNVKFVEDQQHSIEALAKQVAQKLEGITIKLNANNVDIDVSGIQSKLASLQNIDIINKASLQQAEESLKGIVQLFTNAFSGTQSGAQFKDLLTALKDLTAQVQAVANAASTMGTTIGVAFTAALTQANDKIKEILQNLLKVDEVLNGGGGSSKPSTTTDTKNIAAAAKEYENIAKQLQSIDAEVEKAKRLKVDTSDIEKAKADLLKVQQIFKEISDPNFKGQKRLTSDVIVGENVRGLQVKARSELQSLKDDIRQAFNKEAADNMLNGVRSKLKELGDLSKEAGHKGFTELGQKAKEAENVLTGVYNKLQAIRDRGGSATERSLVVNSAEMNSALKKLAEVKKGLAEAQKNAEKAVVKTNKEQANAEIRRLQNYLKELKKLQSEGLSKATNKEAFKNTAGYKEIENAIKQLQEYINKLKEAKQAGQSIGHIDLGNFKASEAAATMQRLSQSQRDAVVSANEVARAQERMGQAIQGAIDKASQQSYILSDLKSMATQYLSVWGAWNFAKEVANITGELELQQKSLEVILGSAGQAQELFNNIKGLSQMSPYTFQDMLKSTRQLAAFGVETKDLYSTMKSLSDLGAGLNVDVQRLILAYGHVKSAGVLSGIQRRQFETAGINITGEIAKLYNERYRESGSTERVSSADIFKRITKREIGFEDVEEAIKRLTGPGGKFYNMQLEQYETLGGKLRNLRNNYNIMLDEIGKAHMDLLMGSVNTLNSLMENWRKWEKVIKSVGAALIAAKVAQMALGKTFMAHRAANLANMNTMREIAMAQATTTGWGGFWRKKAWGGHSVLGLDYAQKISDSDINRFQKARAVMYGNVTRSARELLLVEQGFTPVYAKHVAQMNGLRLGFERLKMSARSFFATMRAGISALISSPMTWIMVAVAGFTALVKKGDEVEQQFKSIRKVFGENLREDVETMKSEVGNYKDILEFQSNTHVQKNGRVTSYPTINVDSLRNEDPKQVMEELDASLQRFDPLYRGHLFDIQSMQGEADRVAKMLETLDNVQKAKEMVARQSGAVASAVASTGYQGDLKNLYGLGDTSQFGKWDTLLDEMKEFQQEYNNLVSTVKANEDVLKDLWSQGKDTPVAEGTDYTWQQNYRKGVEQIKRIAEESGIEYSEAFERFLVNGNLDGIFDKAGNKIKQSFYVTMKDLKDAYGNTIDKFYIDTNALTDKISGIKTKLAPVIRQLMAGLNDIKDTTPEFKGTYIAQFLDSLFNTEGYQISGEAREALTELILKELDASITKGMPPEKAEEFRNRIISQIFSGSAATETTSFLEDAVMKGLVDAQGPTSEQLKVLRQKFIDGPLKKATEGKDTQTAGYIKKAFLNAFNNGIEQLKGTNLKDWQKQIKDALGLKNFDRDLQVRLGIKVDSNTDISGVITECRKKFAECQKTVIDTFKTTLKSKLNITIDPAVNFTSLKGIENLKQQIIDAALKTGQGSYDAKRNLFSFQNSATELAQEVIAMLNPMADMFKIKDATGFDTVGPNKEVEKQQKAAERAQKKRDAERRKKEAEERKREAEERRQWNKRIENLREEISMINEARNEYKKWKKDLSDSSALQAVIDNFTKRGLYGKGKIFEPGDLDNIEDFSAVLAKVEKKIKDLKSKTKDKDRQDQLDGLLKDIAKAASDNFELIFSTHSEKLLREASSQIDTLTKKWEIYNSVLEKTGDKMLALQMSGASIFELGSMPKLDDLLHSLDTRTIRDITALYPGKTFEEIFNLDEIMKLDDKGIEDYVRNLFGKTFANGDLSVAEDVQAITAWIKELKKTMEDLRKKSIDTYTSILSKTQDYNSKVMRINQELSDTVRDIKSNDSLSERQSQAIYMARVQAEQKMIEQSPGYAAFQSDPTRLGSGQMKVMLERLSNLYSDMLEVNLLSTDEYTKKIEDLFKKRRDYNKSIIESWFDITPEGRANRKFKKSLNDYMVGYEAYEESRSKKDSFEEKYQRMLDDYNAIINLGMEEKDLRSKGRSEEANEKQEAKEEAYNAFVNTWGGDPTAVFKQMTAQQEKMGKDLEKARKDLDTLAGNVEDAGNNADNKGNTKSIFDEVVKNLKRFHEALDLVTNVLDSFGMDTSITEGVSSVVGGALSGAGALSFAGPWGMAAGAVLGMVSGLSQLHDKALQRKIDDIKDETEKMNNTLEAIRSLRERTLGYDNGDIRRMLGSQYTKTIKDIVREMAHGGGSISAAEAAMSSYYTRYSQGSGYEQELKLLTEQRQKIMDMYDLEDSKKKSDKNALEEYKKQIAELDEQIAFFTEDLAKELWGIDLKGWASQLSDALTTAFENGTDAASAFKDAVQDIMRGVVKNMLTVGIIEPALEKLREKLFGTNGKGGIFNPDDPENTIGPTLEALGDWFKGDGALLMDATYEFLNGADDLLKQTLGYGLKESDRSSSATTNSLQSTASEETMGIVAGYLSRLSQDVSVQRIIQEMFVNGSFPDYIEQVTTANNSLSNIDRNTMAMMEMMRDGNGALYERVENMSHRLDNFANGIDKLSIR